MKHPLFLFFFAIIYSQAAAQNVSIIKQYGNNQTMNIVQVNDEGFILAPKDDGDNRFTLLDYSGTRLPYELDPEKIGFVPDISFKSADRWILVRAEYDNKKEQCLFQYTSLFPESGALDFESVPFFDTHSAYNPEYSICISPNKKFIGFVIIPFVKSYNDKKRTAHLLLFSSDMNLLWKRTIEFDNKKQGFAVKIACDDLQNIYLLNGIREKPFVENFNTYYIASYNPNQTQIYSLENQVLDHKLLTLCGTQDGLAITGFTLNPDSRKYASGTIFLKLQAGSLNVKVQKTNKIAESTYSKFAHNDVILSRMERANGLLYMQMDIQPYVLQNGTIAVAARYFSSRSEITGTSTIGSLFIFFYDTIGLYQENVVRLNHRCSTMIDILTHHCSVVENKLYIFFNDLSTNADVIEQREPEPYTILLSLASEETTTYVVILDPTDVPKKIPLVNYKSHNFIMQSAYTFDGISWLLYGTNSPNLAILNKQLTSILLWIN